MAVAQVLFTNMVASFSTIESQALAVNQSGESGPQKMQDNYAKNKRDNSTATPLCRPTSHIQVSQNGGTPNSPKSFDHSSSPYSFVVGIPWLNPPHPVNHPTANKFKSRQPLSRRTNEDLELSNSPVMRCSASCCSESFTPRSRWGCLEPRRGCSAFKNMKNHRDVINKQNDENKKLWGYLNHVHE